MIRYKLYQIKNQKSPGYLKWYARAVTEEIVDVEGLAKHMSTHNTPYSKGVIKGILTDAVNCIKELILDGKSVKINDLAIFSGGLVSREGADKKEDFNPSMHIKSYRLRSRATGELRPVVVKNELTMREFTTYGHIDLTTGGTGSPGTAQPADGTAQPADGTAQPVTP